MSLPTLLKIGSILPQKWMNAEQKKKLKTIPAIEWILEYIQDRSWNKSNPPKVKIKGPGSKVGIFRSGTGTGKSTVFPPYLFKKFFEERGVKKNIVCTQPTVATATDIPYQIIMNYKYMIMGKTIGFQTGSLTRKPTKGVIFATVGIILQQLKLLTDEEFMDKYSFIILDEIHVRSVDEDTTLFYLRRFLDRNYENPECPFIILTSGTFEPEVFMNYFNCPKDSFLDIQGSSFPIVDNYSEFDISDYMTYVVDLVEKIHLDNISDITSNKIFRDILIFVQGDGQIQNIVNAVHKLNVDILSKGLEYAKQHSEEQQKKYKKGGNEQKELYYLCPVSVNSTNIQKGGVEYQNIFSDISSILVPIYEFKNSEKTDNIIKYVSASRRVLVATNSIETGLTIDTLKYCIDTGYVNESQFNPNFGVDVLCNKNVTKASAIQRRGRVGRKEPGLFYTCYTKATFDALTPLPFPEIVRSDITSSLLDIIINESETTLIELDQYNIDKHPEAFQMNQFDQRWYGLDVKKSVNIASLLFIQTPAADSFEYGLEKLRILGFIDHEYKPTVLGWYGSKFRKVYLEDVRMILAGYHHGANILDLITISCMVSMGHKLIPKKKKYVPQNVLNVSKEESVLYNKMVFTDEFIEYLFIWYSFMEYVEKLGYDMSKQLNKKNKNKFKDTDNNPFNLVEKINKWCDEQKIDTDIMLKIVTARDELMGDLLNIGMNPFYNGLGIQRGKYNLINILRNNLQEGIEEIQKIKKCIYEGYRLNLYIWDVNYKKYISPITHNAVSLDTKLLNALILDDDIKQNRPQKIILSDVILRAGMSSDGLYEFMGSDVCSLDGYVDVDLGFVNYC